MNIMQWILVVGILICIVALIVLSVKRSAAEKEAAAAPVTPERKEEKTTPEKKPPVKQESVIPVVTLFEDPLRRNVRRCPHCDGENQPNDEVCGICGRKL